MRSGFEPLTTTAVSLSASTSLIRTRGASAVFTVHVRDVVALAIDCHTPASFWAMTCTVYVPLVKPLSTIGGTTAVASPGFVTVTVALQAPPLTRYWYA